MLINLPTRTIEISSPLGGHDALHIMSGGYFLGKMVKYNGAWEVRSHKSDTFTEDDVRVIVEAVTALLF